MVSWLTDVLPRRALAGVVLLAALSSCAGSFGAKKPMLWGFNMSPDGKTVAFQYCGTKRPMFCRLGLLHLANGKITHIPGPGGQSLWQPSFSNDGRRLVAIVGQENTRIGPHVVVIDLATQEITQLTEERANRSFPAFQPGTDNILYVVGYDKGATHRYFHLRLNNISKRTETVILAAKDGFRSGILRPSFLGSDEVIFGAIAPSDPGLSETVRRLAGSVFHEFAFRLRFGGRPEIFLPDIQLRRIGSSKPSFSSLAASENGEEIVLIHRSLIEPKTNRGKYNYELFKLENGKLKALTNLRSHLLSAHVSLDGSKVAFGSDPNRRGEWDLFILDMKTGSIWATNLLDRLAKHPKFAPKR